MGCYRLFGDFSGSFGSHDYRCAGFFVPRIFSERFLYWFSERGRALGSRSFIGDSPIIIAAMAPIIFELFIWPKFAGKGLPNRSSKNGPL